MPKILHEACPMKCALCAGAIRCPAPQNQLAHIAGNRILVEGDQFTIDVSNCIYQKNATPAVCNPGPMAFSWTTTPSELKKIQGQKVLMQKSVGSFIGAIGVPVAVQIEDSDPPTDAKTK